MKKKRRIFIGYAISTKMQEAIKEWSTKFGDLPIRWTAPENLHVTLVPPWYEQDVENVISCLGNATFPVAPFVFRFETVVLGPDKKRPRLFWATGETPQDFVKLKNYLSEVLKQKKETRVPLVHVTLARFRSEQADLFPTKEYSEQVSWQDTLFAITIFESHLQKTGAVYTKLAEISLQK